MDAVQKLLKSSFLFPVLLIALLSAAPAWGQQFVLSSNTVTCAGTSCPGNGTVNITSTGANIQYSVSQPNYSSDTGTNGIWLVVTPTGGPNTTPGSVTFSLGNLSGLTQGFHTATVTITATD